MGRRKKLILITATAAPLFVCDAILAAEAQSVLSVLASAFGAITSGLVLGIVLMARDKEKAKTRQLAEVYKGISEALASAVAAKDSYEKDHVRHVVAISSLTAKALGLSEHECDGIRIAALVHDVGKLGVPDYIMLKPGPLDPDEFGKMRNHAAIGASILEQVTCPWNIVDVVRHHHERYDGTGYPDALSGDTVPIGSRILAVAEVYDALVSDRCYKERWQHEDAVEYISKSSGTHFDPAVVKAFLSVADQVLGLYADSKCRSHEVREEKSRSVADEIARANQELVSLFEIAQTLSSTLELDEVLGLLAQRTRRMLQASTCVVFLSDVHDHGKLSARAVSGRHHDTAKLASVIKGQGATGEAYVQCKPYVGDYDALDGIVTTEAAKRQIKSSMVVPIVGHGRPLGTINVYDDAPKAFSANDLHTLTSVAERAAIAIRNARAFEHVRDSAMKDPLTGLANGRNLRAHLDNELRRAQRQGQPLSVLAIDLDNFKAVNDTMGHQAGDTVLQQAAGIFLAQLREYDMVARVGGDEFVVVLPGTPAEEASLIAERIQHHVESYARKALTMDCAPLGTSIGVAAYPANGQDAETLLARADDAMYAEKRAHKQANQAA